MSGLSGLELVPITLEVAVRAAQVRATYNLPMAGSLHAASAIVGKADVFLTNDRTFARLEEFEPVFLDDYS